MDYESWMLLIYPYWNVNWEHTMQKVKLLKLLIYPYWNVNFSIYYSHKNMTLLLIYPYWNVNAFMTGITATNIKPFNLSILECK